MESIYTYTGLPTLYPDGAVSLNPDEYGDDYPIIRVRDSDGAITSLQAIRRHPVIHLPYFPYARADHPPKSDLSTYINALDAQRKSPATIVTYDPHSSSIQTLIDQTKFLELHVREQDLFNNIIHYVENLKSTNKPVLVATERYTNFFKLNNPSVFAGYIPCVKFASNPLPLLDPEGYQLKPNTNFIVVDDICDTGETVINIAKILDVVKERVSLYVSHGIFSEGTQELYKHFSNIATTNSFIQPSEVDNSDIIIYALYESELTHEDSDPSSDVN